MCGRFTHRYTWRQLHRLMRITTPEPAEELLPRYNVAPTQTVPVVREDRDGNRTVAMMRWGLGPYWAKDISIGNRQINARSGPLHGQRRIAFPPPKPGPRFETVAAPVSGVPSIHEYVVTAEFRSGEFEGGMKLAPARVVRFVRTEGDRPAPEPCR